MAERRVQPLDQENPWIEGLKTIGLSLVLAFGIRTFIAEARYIPSGSMRPTLIENDRLIVDKVSYHFQAPQRGDIVVFNPTDALLQQNFHDALIKRVIGLPGETVEVRGGRVYVNGKPLRENYIAAQPDYVWGPQIVPAGSYLVLGDNRNNSYDGHYWGFVPQDRIIGKAVIRFWPFDRLDILSYLRGTIISMTHRETQPTPKQPIGNYLPIPEDRRAV